MATTRFSLLKRWLYALCMVAVCFLLPTLTRAADLQHLFITQFSLEADHREIDLSDVVHLHFQAHVREHIDQLNNLKLPDMHGFELIGNESHLNDTKAGTDYIEDLSLAPQQEGTFVLGPILLYFIDSHKGPSVASSNTVKIVVEHHDVMVDFRLLLIRSALIVALAIIGGIVTFYAGKAGLFWLSGRLPRRSLPEPDVEPSLVVAQPAHPHVPGRERLRQAINQARRDPTSRQAVLVRGALRDVLGATSDETLADLLVRFSDGERAIFGRALRAIERAVFIQENEQSTAIEDSLVLVEAALAKLELETPAPRGDEL